jgi:hypothetical protein
MHPFEFRSDTHSPSLLTRCQAGYITVVPVLTTRIPEWTHAQRHDGYYAYYQYEKSNPIEERGKRLGKV